MTTSAFLNPASMSPERDLDPLGDVGRLVGLGLDADGEQVVVEQGGVRPHRLLHVDDVGQHLVLHLDQLERAPGDGHAGRGDGGHRVALVEGLLAGHHVPHHVLVVHHHLAGRDELRRLVGEVVAGDDGLHAGQRLRLRRVDREDAGVRVRAPKHPPDELTRQVEVGAEAGAAGDLVHPVRTDRARADVALPIRAVRPGLPVLGHGLTLSHRDRGVLHRGDDLVVPGAPTQVAGQPVADLGVRRIGIPLEERLAGHDEAGRADPALQRGVLQELLLERMERLAPSPRPRSCPPGARRPRSPARGRSRPAGRRA